MSDQMINAITGSMVFWFSFAFTIGPFWLMLMQAAKDYPITYIYKHYIPHYTLSLLPLLTVIASIVSFVNLMELPFFKYMYILGAGVIFFLAYRALRSTVTAAKIEYNWKVMAMVTFTNPKMYISAPVGALSATFTDNAILNGFLFGVVAFPIFCTALGMWYYIGRIGYRLAAEKFAYFNCTLLCGFAIYLLYSAPIWGDA